MVDFIVKHPNIGAAISFHTHSGVILRPMGTQSDDDMIARGPVVDQALQRARREADRLSGDQHLARLQVPPEGGHHRHAGLGLRAPRRAVLGRRDLGAEQGSRHHRLQVDRLVPRAPGRRRPEAAQVERRAVRRPGPRRLAAVPASAARRGRDRRLGQDELLAQPAAAPARARGRALPGLDDADRAVAAASSSCCAPRCARSATTPGASASRSPTAAGCRPTSASARSSARSCAA